MIDSSEITYFRIGYDDGLNGAAPSFSGLACFFPAYTAGYQEGEELAQACREVDPYDQGYADALANRPASFHGEWRDFHAYHQGYAAGEYDCTEET